MRGLGDVLGIVIVGSIISFVIFLILREVFCWYWKINSRLKLMEDINSKLTALVYQRESSSASDETKATESEHSLPVTCPQCGKDTSENDDYCDNCGYKLTSK